MNGVRLIVPVTPRRGWRNARIAEGERVIAASPVVRGFGTRRRGA